MIKPRNGGQSNRRQPYNYHISKMYEDGIFNRKLPIVTTDPSLLEEQARKAMGQKPFGYIYAGAGVMLSVEANRRAFDKWRIIPRYLKPSSPRDLTVKLFGEVYGSPLLIAPMGVQGTFHPSGERGIIAACAELGIPYSLSTAATTSIEDVADACGSHPHWYQLYWPKDDDITVSLLSRVKASGYRALIVTLDTTAVGWRPHDLDLANLPFLEGIGNAVAFSDPVFRSKFSDISNGDTPEKNPTAAARFWISQVASGYYHSWEDLALLRKHWDGPILLKGVLSVEDAKLALKHGMNGIIVSNHGGRQLDGELTVMFDSGIRTGSDIIKAIALGAQAVLVGRPVLYGLGIAGKDGAIAVLANLLADLDQSMGISGFTSITDLQRSILREAK
ncbi:FMN-dependent dehydrogenase [Trichoderma evansii]